MSANEQVWRCLPYGHTWIRKTRRDSRMCPHCGTNACERAQDQPLKKDAKKTPKQPRVRKPTEEIKNLIILASDVNYHVVRYARLKTIRLPGGWDPSVAAADDVRTTVIKQCQQLIALLKKTG